MKTNSYWVRDVHETFLARDESRAGLGRGENMKQMVRLLFLLGVAALLSPVYAEDELEPGLKAEFFDVGAALKDFPLSKRTRSQPCNSLTRRSITGSRCKPGGRT